jgi:hypothetical protein
VHRRSIWDTRGLSVLPGLCLAFKDVRDGRGDRQSLSGKVFPSCVLPAVWKRVGKDLPTLRSRKAVTRNATTSAWTGRSVLVNLCTRLCDEDGTHLVQSTRVGVAEGVQRYLWIH